VANPQLTPNIPDMNMNSLIEGLLGYVCLVIALTFHEFAHAWAAWKCGDDTSRLQGRVSLNPIVHMDLLGTVILPLMMIFLSSSGSGLAKYLIGWGKPVPVNPYNLNNRRRDDTLIALAGPAINLALAVVTMGIAKVFSILKLDSMVEVMFLMTVLNLVLCFFNLLPVPPLDGSHVIKNAIGMSEELYMRLSQFGFFALILIIQIPAVRGLLSACRDVTLTVLVKLYGF